jgi:2-(1,2-epoxy-1,2-dihydrophenyl)acetyl-CoA isomerase
MNQPTTFLYEQDEQGIATITLNRPERLNALTFEVYRELTDMFATLRDERDVRVVVITGAGRAFCAGGDVEFMASLQQSGDLAAFRKLLDAGRDIVLQIATMPKPVIAAINGVAAGAGCNLALACDYRIASEQARLSESFVRIGLNPDWGGTWLLPRLVGRARAMELMLSGRMVDAAEALAIGMVDRVVADLPSETEQLARMFAAAPPLAAAGIKRAVNAAEANDLRAQLELEADHQLGCFQSQDAKDRIAAFLAKR